MNLWNPLNGKTIWWRTDRIQIQIHIPIHKLSVHFKINHNCFKIINQIDKWTWFVNVFSKCFDYDVKPSGPISLCHTYLAKQRKSCTSRANCLADSSWSGESTSSAKSSAWVSRACWTSAPWGCSPPTCQVWVSVWPETKMYPNVSVSVVAGGTGTRTGTGRPADSKQNCTIVFPKKGETEKMSMHPFSLLHTIPHILFFSMQLPLHAWKRQGSMILMHTDGSSCTIKLMMLSDPNVQIAQCCSTKAATDYPSKLKINGWYFATISRGYGLRCGTKRSVTAAEHNIPKHRVWNISETLGCIQGNKPGAWHVPCINELPAVLAHALLQEPKLS